MENNSLNPNTPQQDINKTPEPSPIEPVVNVVIPRKNSKTALFALLGLLFFFLLVVIIGATIVLAAYNKITLPNQKLQEGISYFIQDLPFMPKTPKYLLLKSAKAHESIGSAYTKISAAVKSDGFSQIPGIGNTIEILGQGPIDVQNPENPKMSWKLNVTNDFESEFKLSEKILYFKINKIPALLYPFIGLTSSNFATNPYLNKWVYYDMNTLETDSSKLLDERGENLTTNELTEAKLILLGNKLSEKMVTTEEDLENTPVYRISLKLTNQELQELEPEIVELFDMKSTDYDSDIKDAQDTFSMVDNVELNVWIEKSTHYVRRFDFAADIKENKIDNYSQVLGIKTVANETSKQNVASFALSISFSKLGENFENDFKAPSTAISFDQYMLEITDFMDNNLGYELYRPKEEEGFKDEDLEGFEDPQIYSPPTGKTPLSY
jgi:hypothetical protein